VPVIPPLQDPDVALWVCPEFHEWQEWRYPEGPKPRRTNCSKCNAAYVTECAGRNCAERTFHWSDFWSNYHVCGQPIPWQTGRSATVWAFGKPYSRLLGTTPEEPLEREEKKSAQASRPGGITWDELENPDRPRVAEMQAVSSPRQWWRGLSGPGKWIAGIVGSTIAGVAVLLIGAWLVSIGVLPPVLPRP
jgi:hypothetical protein